MKVLWLCNVGTQYIYQLFGLEGSPYGGWIEGALTGLSEKGNIEIAVCFPSRQKEEIMTQRDHLGVYYSFRIESNSPEKYCKKYERYFQTILDDFKPDLVHIWGTEFAHTLAMVKSFGKPDSTVISIQGLCSVCAKHYFAYMPNRRMIFATLRDIIRSDTLNKQRHKFLLRGKNEIESIKNVDHVIGRTEWDFACSKQINPKIVYHHCGEILRKSFYEGAWDVEMCEPHSLFASQADYPIKGFHLLLEAASIIIKRFPDLKIYTTSRDPRKVGFLKRTTYEQYLVHLMNRLKLNESITFLGRLNEMDMRDRYLKSNVFVSASSIENSSNSIGEAMVLGVPTISSDVGGTKDFIQHNKNGFIYPADEPYMLAEYVCEVFDDKEKAIQLSNEARKNIQYYDCVNNTNQLIEIYQSM